MTTIITAILIAVSIFIGIIIGWCMGVSATMDLWQAGRDVEK